VSEQSGGGRDEFAVGSVVGGYRLGEVIGRGRMGAVFRAFAPRLGEDIALKLLVPGFAVDEPFRERFMRESRVPGTVGSPHIVPVVEAGWERGVLFIAMRLVTGGDLGSLLRRSGPLAPERVAEIVAQLASALDAAHARGLVHRDVKPTSVLMDESARTGGPDKAWLSDFELPEMSLAVISLAAEGHFPGSLDHVAPEQLAGRPVDGQADQYGLACTAFELLTGAPPIRRGPGRAAMLAQASEPPPLLSSRRAGLPARADEVLSRALAASTAYRYATCGDFAADLRRALGPGAARTGRLGHGPALPAPQLPAGTWRSMADARAGAATPAGMAADPPVAAGRPRGDSLPQLPPPWPADPPAVAPSYRAGPRVRPGLREPRGGPADPAAAGRRAARSGSGRPRPTGHQRRSWWHLPTPLAAVGTVIVVLAVGGYYLLGHHSGKVIAAPRPATSRPVTPRRTAPGCRTSVAPAGRLAGVRSEQVRTGGRPFAVRESPDGRFAFVTVGGGVAVLRTGTGLAPALVRTIQVPEANKELAISADGRYLLAAGGRGAVVISVARAEQGAADPVLGRLNSPQGGAAADVLTSPDGKYAFVTLQASSSMAVFRLGRALQDGFGPADFVGFVPLGNQPVGLAESPDGNWLYATSFQRSASPAPAEGTLSVISVRRAETAPATSVVSVVSAGCSPARIITDGPTVWVTARDSNALLAYSAARLRTDPARSILAEVDVGMAPIGLTFAAGDSRIIVADSDLNGTRGRAPGLDVISVPAALAGRPALLGSIPAGPVTRDVTLASNGKTILATSEVTGLLQAVSITSLSPSP
jgi:DNA-binding beta-propeller fold protein YncE